MSAIPSVTGYSGKALRVYDIGIAIQGMDGYMLRCIKLVVVSLLLALLCACSTLNASGVPATDIGNQITGPNQYTGIPSPNAPSPPGAGGYYGDGGGGGGGGTPYTPLAITKVWVERNPDRLFIQTHGGPVNTPKTISITESHNLVFETMSVELESSSTAEFPFWFTDQLTAGPVEITATAESGEELTEPYTEDLGLGFRDIREHEALCAIPRATRTAVGEPVLIQVYTSFLPFNRDLSYADSVAVTWETGGAYVAGSLNVGGPGGGQKFPDGVWGAMKQIPVGFLLPEDEMLQAVPVSAQPGREYVAFNVTPIGGGYSNMHGHLFNFELAFDEPGTYTLGFLAFDEVERTYYSNQAGWRYSWSNIGNDFEQFTTSVTVVE